MGGGEASRKWTGQDLPHGGQEQLPNCTEEQEQGPAVQGGLSGQGGLAFNPGSAAMGVAGSPHLLSLDFLIS